MMLTDLIMRLDQNSILLCGWHEGVSIVLCMGKWYHTQRLRADPEFPVITH